jgi:transcriptional regulator with XRE-family HTH domain
MMTLRGARAERAYSIRDLGMLSGVSTSTIFSIESGRALPRPRVMRALAEALDYPVGDITEFRAAIEQAKRPTGAR